jgi:AcrR family transcriptional regulator
MSSRPRERLGVDDWVRAALEIMASEGIGGVRIPRLCERLGVTKGSFYWHFADLDAFLAAIADQWEAGEGTFRLDHELSIDALVGAFVDHRLSRLERAMRDWARTDERAKSAIRASDERAFAKLVTVFESLGFDHADADVRAKVLFYAGVGFGDVGPIGDRGDTKRQVQALLALLTAQGVSSS